MSNPIERVGVVGAGQMGAGIAEVSARAGVDVIVYEPTEALTAYSRGLMFENRGDNAKAADSYQRALSSFPDYPEAREGLQRVR